MKIIKNITIDSSHAQLPISLDVFFQDNGILKPIIIFCHGFKGFKDWGYWDRIATFFGEQDYIFVKFNFSHNGVKVEQPEDISDLDAFSNNSFSKEMDDLDRVVNYILSSDFVADNQLNSRKILLIGHSRGGAVALLKANEDSRIKSVAAWAPVHDIDEWWPNSLREQWEKDEIRYVENARTKQKLPMKYHMVEDYMAQKQRFNIPKAVSNLSIPMLVVHGDQDEHISFNSARLMESWNSGLTFTTIEGGTHTFGMKHPADDGDFPKHTDELLHHTLDFFHNNFAK